MRAVTIATVESEEQLDRLVRAERDRASAARPGREVSVTATPLSGEHVWPRLVTLRRRVAAKDVSRRGEPLVSHGG